MAFSSEAEFEQAFIEALKRHGWDDKDGVIKHPSEQDLINNWARILYENNNTIDRLNGCPLSEGEMRQVIEQVIAHRTPLALNDFINGKTVAITRDNPADADHLGKEVSLKIYDRAEIAGGQSRYQIAEQPHYRAKSALLNDRRGDVVLLINGMPLIHVELKRSGVALSEAVNQIVKYSEEGVFTGLFSLVQVFVAMKPEESVYFANPGPDGTFNPDYQFHWADFNNEIEDDWHDVTRDLLSIPMAHQLIGFYTVADSADGILKVMRSYQYFAASRIADRVTKVSRHKDWGGKNVRGGFIWHTTGSGKTMTSFKSAQLIANSKDADKVVFLVDRIELGTQSLEAYRGFADEADDVQATENTDVLKTKLKSDNPSDTLIVTSIQKMSNIYEGFGGINEHDLQKIRQKRIVFIVDECHRSQYGDMHQRIKQTFPDAMFFGFSGTPTMEEDSRKDSTTATIFGDELHRYTIHDGIRDGNVLGFDPYMVCTFRDKDVRRAVALAQAKAQAVEEVYEDPKKAEVFDRFMNPAEVQMAGHRADDGKWVKGIEDYLPVTQYTASEDPANSDGPSAHQLAVVDDIVDNFTATSKGGRYHAILATSSIAEAIRYHRIFLECAPQLRVTALFDPNIDNNEGAVFKEGGLVEVLEAYNKTFDQDFTIPHHAAFKLDVSNRLAHKGAYRGIQKDSERAQRLDLLIVVDQMLTGFDSKWVNTLYLDKVLYGAGLIQAFSRTNRLNGKEKPFGVVRYYRYPHTMRRNVDDALRLYSGDKPLMLFVQKLDGNLLAMNSTMLEIRMLFAHAGLEDFHALPDDVAARGKFAQLFGKLSEHLEAAKVQGFHWGELSYDFEGEDGETRTVTLDFDENTYLTLALRYKELRSDGPGVVAVDEVPFDIDPYLVEIDTGIIDEKYMEENFSKWLKALNDGDEAENALEALHSTFATLSQEDQRAAGLIIHDIQTGDLTVDGTTGLHDYIAQYRRRQKDERILQTAQRFGVDADLLSELVELRPTPDNINEYGRFDRLMATLDKAKAKETLERESGETITPFKVKARADKYLRAFVFKSAGE